jgi:hypothetical protein
VLKCSFLCGTEATCWLMPNEWDVGKKRVCGEGERMWAPRSYIQIQRSPELGPSRNQAETSLAR